MQIIIAKVRNTLRKRIGVYEKALYCSAGMEAVEQLSEFRYILDISQLGGQAQIGQKLAKLGPFSAKIK